MDNGRLDINTLRGVDCVSRSEIVGQGRSKIIFLGEKIWISGKIARKGDFQMFLSLT